MIIKSKPLSPFMFKCVGALVNVFFKMRFNKMVINEAEINPNHSYILMCNHFGFLDGLLAFYLCNKLLYKQNAMRKLYIMSVKKQMEKKWWLQYLGSFSVDPGRRSIIESFEYAAEMLSQPGNLLLYYPQGELESLAIRHVKFDEGIYEIASRVKGNCQLLWSSNLIEYFESIKPSAYFNLLDCGTTSDFDFETLKEKVNQFHKTAIARNIRYTREP